MKVLQQWCQHLRDRLTAFLRTRWQRPVTDSRRFHQTVIEVGEVTVVDDAPPLASTSSFRPSSNVIATPVAALTALLNVHPSSRAALKSLALVEAKLLRRVPLDRHGPVLLRNALTQLEHLCKFDKSPELGVLALQIRRALQRHQAIEQAERNGAMPKWMPPSEPAAPPVSLVIPEPELPFRTDLRHGVEVQEAHDADFSKSLLGDQFFASAWPSQRAVQPGWAETQPMSVL